MHKYFTWLIYLEQKSAKQKLQIAPKGSCCSHLLINFKLSRAHFRAHMKTCQESTTFKRASFLLRQILYVSTWYLIWFLYKILLSALAFKPLNFQLAKSGVDIRHHGVYPDLPGLHETTTTQTCTHTPYEVHHNLKKLPDSWIRQSPGHTHLDRGLGLRMHSGAVYLKVLNGRVICKLHEIFNFTFLQFPRLTNKPTLLGLRTFFQPIKSWHILPKAFKEKPLPSKFVRIHFIQIAFELEERLEGLERHCTTKKISDTEKSTKYFTECDICSNKKVKQTFQNGWP